MSFIDDWAHTARVLALSGVFDHYSLMPCHAFQLRIESNSFLSCPTSACMSDVTERCVECIIDLSTFGFPSLHISRLPRPVSDFKADADSEV